MYKLVNKTTKEEHICTKVIVDGFYYYVSNVIPKKDNLWVMQYQHNYLGKTFYPENDGTVSDEVIKKYLLSVNYEGHYSTIVSSLCGEVIATNNPNIDIPKVIDEVEELALLLYPKPFNPDSILRLDGYRKAFLEGYNKHKETNHFSEEDVKFMLSEAFKASQEGYGITYDEVLELWKEQKVETIYYQ